jgi:hypothetical protein
MARQGDDSAFRSVIRRVAGGACRHTLLPAQDKKAEVPGAILVHGGRMACSRMADMELRGWSRKRGILEN